MAKVSGIAIRPGVSANKRRYTSQAIAKATARLQKRLADESAWPVNMFTSHERAGVDDAQAVAGQVRKVWLTEDGALAYEGQTTDTAAGKEVAQLATPDADGNQFLRHVSIRAFMLGPVTKDEQGNECADDLEIVGLDFTGRPGVTGTSVTAESAARASHTESVRRTYITESAEEATYMTTKTLTAEDLKALRGEIRAGRFTADQRAAILEAVDADSADGVLAVLQSIRSKSDSGASLTKASSQQDFLEHGVIQEARFWNTHMRPESTGRPEPEARDSGDAFNSRAWLALRESGFLGSQN
jgi:hypothetical protein